MRDRLANAMEWLSNALLVLSWKVRFGKSKKVVLVAPSTDDVAGPSDYRQDPGDRSSN